MNKSNEWLTSVAESIQYEKKGGAAPTPVHLTAREFLGKFDAKRRGRSIVNNIRNQLEEAGLRTEPDFEFAYIDSKISVVSVSEFFWRPQRTT